MNGQQVECSSCGKPVNPEQCYLLYAGMGWDQLICPECQKLPFKDVMAKLDVGKSYVQIDGTYMTLEELHERSCKRNSAKTFNAL